MSSKRKSIRQSNKNAANQAIARKKHVVEPVKQVELVEVPKFEYAAKIEPEQIVEERVLETTVPVRNENLIVTMIAISSALIVVLILWLCFR